MALKNVERTWPAWDVPVWPETLPPPDSIRLIYGGFADELVVRFDDDIHFDEVVFPVVTPDVDYAGLMVAGNSGAVVGINVYPLAAFAVRRHPAWQAATLPNPSPDVAARIVSDVKELFDRYGIELDPEG